MPYGQSLDSLLKMLAFLTVLIRRGLPLIGSPFPIYRPVRQKGREMRSEYGIFAPGK